LDVIWIDIYFDVFDFRHHRYGDSRGMNSSVGFRIGNSLYSMNATFKLQLGVDALTGNLYDSDFETSNTSHFMFDNVCFPSASFCISEIHSEKFFSK